MRRARRRASAWWLWRTDVCITLQEQACAATMVPLNRPYYKAVAKETDKPETLVETILESGLKVVGLWDFARWWEHAGAFYGIHLQNTPIYTPSTQSIKDPKCLLVLYCSSDFPVSFSVAVKTILGKHLSLIPTKASTASPFSRFYIFCRTCSVIFFLNEYNSLRYFNI